ncbi:DUF1580 domain-containing protein [Mariniblastus fucicola]|uniref:DNA-binding protein n=1 Tax=Mariniblastus fucicola TaxID=980251 RepID=A0A5B9PC62_9BACT|nr:DUF1580 domain-containing protein [Mariniblastus fucicola]QEG23898.1 hypothetical protein MFFC18_38020 [Mariniblastus fucicola]
MINLLAETPVPISKVPAWVSEHCGFQPNRSTVFRWTTRGSGGRILSTIKVGGRRVTTVEALLAFFESDGPAAQCVSQSASDTEAYLESEGI